MNERGVRRWQAALLLAGLLAGPAAPLAREIVVRAEGQAAIAQPMVAFQLRDGRSGKALTAADELEELVGPLPTVAVLDTGASAHVLSQGTAVRLHVAREAGARYVEVGMAGQHAMGVSRPYALALAQESGAVDDDSAADGARQRRPAARERPSEPGRGASRPDLVVDAQRLLLNDAPSDLQSLLSSPGAALDVVGMPAIREMVVELEPQRGAPLVVRLHPRDAGVGADVWIALTMSDFNRTRDPQNRGPLPSLAQNPLVPGVRAIAGRETARGDWLLDTGAAVTMLSVASARALGLVDDKGKPTREPDFTVPVGGISGGGTALAGFRIDRIEIAAGPDTVLVLSGPSVVVHDIKTTRDDGREVVLDGVFGMNLLLASGSGFQLLGATTEHPSPFTRIVIDGPRARLGLSLRR